MSRKNKKYIDRDHQAENKPPDPQRSLLDEEDEGAERIGELFIKQIEWKKITKNKNQNNEN